MKERKKERIEGKNEKKERIEAIKQDLKSDQLRWVSTIGTACQDKCRSNFVKEFFFFKFQILSFHLYNIN